MWLGSGEDGVVTWYNPSINIIEEAEDNLGVNIWPRVFLFTPAGHQRPPFALSLYSEKGARAWNSKLKFASRNSARLVYITQSTARCTLRDFRYNSGFVCPTYKLHSKNVKPKHEKEEKSNPQKARSFRHQTYKAKSPRYRVQGYLIFQVSH